MRVQIEVKAEERGWKVRRNGKLQGTYDERARAVAAAENFARAVARYGDAVLVKVIAGGEILEERSFASDIF